MGCAHSTVIKGQKFVCMKYCECSYHATCLEVWRFDGHNLCHNCSAPISHSLFHTWYLGKALAEETVDGTDSSLPIIERAKNSVVRKGENVNIRLKANKTHVRFETISDDEDVALRFKRAIKDVVRIDKLDDLKVAVTFTPEDQRSDKPDLLVIVFGEPEEEPDVGFIVHVFALPTAAEAVCVYESLSLQLARSADFSGSVNDLTMVGAGRNSGSRKGTTAKDGRLSSGLGVPKEFSQSLENLTTISLALAKEASATLTNEVPGSLEDLRRLSFGSDGGQFFRSSLGHISGLDLDHAITSEEMLSRSLNNVALVELAYRRSTTPIDGK